MACGRSGRSARASLWGGGIGSTRALLVGGGVGIAPLAILQDTLAREGELRVLLGFRDGTRARRRPRCCGARVPPTTARSATTVLVTDLLPASSTRDRTRSSTPAGRPPMLEACGRCARRARVPAQLALEAGMACGFGACFGCVVPRRGGGYLRVCVDGPVIDAAELERIDEHAGAPA
jgi:dihydroorotate dehydrogenase electron transfer subunit